MNIYDKLLISVCLIAFICGQATHQAHLFKKGKTISHFWKGMWYAIFVAVLTVPYFLNFGWHLILKVAFIGLTTRAAFFDLILNEIRNEVWYWNGTPTKKGSLLDRLENNLSIPWLKRLKIAYIIIFILTIIFL